MHSDLRCALNRSPQQTRSTHSMNTTAAAALDSQAGLAENTNSIGLGLLRQPRYVFFGPGQRIQIARLAQTLGRGIAIVTDQRMTTTAHFSEIVQQLTDRGLDVSVFDKVDPELPRESLLAAVGQLADKRIDAVIGLGGGSCMDAAKVVAILLAHGGDVRKYYGENLVPGPGLPVITVPTTGGTGAEVTSSAVVYDAEQAMKIGVASPFLEPYAAVVDPEFTLSVPAGLTTATGADALSHLIEAYTSRAKNPTADEIDRHMYVGKNTLTDVYARYGLQLINVSLENVVARPDDLTARTETMLAAHAAGMAINTSGTAAAHAIQSPIGALTSTSHGIGVGALLPYVMRFNLPTRVTVFAEMADVLGVSEPHADPQANAQAAISRIDSILDAIRIPSTLSELGLRRENFEFVAEQALKATRLTANNPRELTKEGIVEILARGHAGDRSFWG
ncbi:iron-containing alcohol dehydrogenase [Rhodococcus sp. NPDC057014]|uniref:iron-containing alcohol dehydrogenase n=1 Tax=Rhodococcus sp. NPDC057014 TaxID=3346000 RepID=UPI00363D1C9C